MVRAAAAAPNSHGKHFEMAPKVDPKAKAKPEAKKKAKAEGEEEEGRMQPPDRTAFDEATAKIQESIDALQKTQADLAKKIAERSGGKEEFFAKKAELRAQLDEFSAKIDKLMERKTEISKAIGDKRQEGVEMRSQLNKMKKSIGYTNEEEIDQRIADIEFKLWTDTIPLKEEKELLKEIQELKKNRPKVSQVKNLEAGLATRDIGGSFKEQSATISEEISLFRDGKKKVQEKMAALMEERKGQLGDLPEIIEKRDAIGKQIAEKVRERAELRDEFREKEREYRKYQDEQRRVRQEKAAEERAARQAEYEKTRRVREAEKLDEQPYVQEMTLIEQTVAFCRSLTSTKEVGEKKEEKEIKHDLAEGMEVLAKKDDREEYYFVPTARKKSKSKNKGKEGGASKPIKHNAETFRLFDQLKLDAPITTDDVAACLEKLEAKLEHYKEKVKEWEQKRDEMKRRLIEEGIRPETDDAKVEKVEKAEEGAEEAEKAEAPAEE